MFFALRGFAIVIANPYIAVVEELVIIGWVSGGRT
jgi:hypothetical protein